MPGLLVGQGHAHWVIKFKVMIKTGVEYSLDGKNIVVWKYGQKLYFNPLKYTYQSSFIDYCHPMYILRSLNMNYWPEKSQGTECSAFGNVYL